MQKMMEQKAYQLGCEDGSIIPVQTVDGFMRKSPDIRLQYMSE